jgi:hypothetical protein
MGRVVFMGAGASKPLGYPLTGAILPAILKKLTKKAALFGRSEADVRAAEDLRRSLQLLLPGLDGFDDDSNLPLVTDILSLIDHSLTSGRTLIQGQTNAGLVDMRRLLERAILHVIETGEPYTDRERQVLTAFTKWLSMDKVDGIISTNYDLAVERELFKPYDTHQGVSRDFDFGVRWRDPDHDRLYEPPADPRVRFYKLHGSLNWLRCECCEHLYINTYGEIADLVYDEVTPSNSCHCGHGPLSTVLVTPSFIRDIRDPNLLGVWTHALELLRKADEWVIVGYSMPPEDIAIRSLLIRAATARDGGHPPRITVVQYGKNPKIRAAYELFFKNCDYREEGLEKYLGMTD